MISMIKVRVVKTNASTHTHLLDICATPEYFTARTSDVPVSILSLPVVNLTWTPLRSAAKS
jgi:hypothetical protein